jgi:hypothetical protein
MAGLRAGWIYGVIFAIMCVVYNYATLPPGYVILTERVIGLIIGYAIGGVILGIILGTIYAAAYKHLPGGKSIPNALSLGIVWWIVVALGIGYGLGIGYILVVVMNVYGIIMSLIANLILGSLIGFFWNRYKAQPIRK